MANAERNVFIFTWKIENYVPYEQISSPIFFVHSIESGFALDLFCRPFMYGDDTLCLYLQLVSECGESTELDFEISCLASDGSALVSKEQRRTRFTEHQSRGFWDFMSLRKVATERRCEFLPQDTLTLQCKIWKSDGDMSESVLCSARSRVGIQKSSFVWPIESFTSIMLGSTTPYSVRKASQNNPMLSMSIQGSYKVNHFELVLTPENVMQILGEEDIDSKIAFCNLKLSFMKASGEEKIGPDIKRLECNRTRTLHVLIPDEVRDKENGYIVADVLSLKLQFEFYEGIFSEEIERTVFVSGSNLRVVLHRDGVITSPSSLKDIHKFLLETQLFCDVILRTRVEWIPAHKRILSARSLVFQSKFEESKEDTLQIDDVAANVLRQMVLFIYTDTVNDIQFQVILELYVAAENYKVLGLKKKCSLLLADNLSKHNVCKMSRFAKEHEDEDLKLAIQGFTLEPEKEVTSTAVRKILQNQNERRSL